MKLAVCPDENFAKSWSSTIASATQPSRTHLIKGTWPTSWPSTFKPEAGGEQHAKRRDHTQIFFVAVESAQDNDGHEHVPLVFEREVLHQHALFLLLRAGDLPAFQLPGAVHGFDLAGAGLRTGSASLVSGEGEDSAGRNELRQS